MRETGKPSIFVCTEDSNVQRLPLILGHQRICQNVEYFILIIDLRVPNTTFETLPKQRKLTGGL